MKTRRRFGTFRHGACRVLPLAVAAVLLAGSAPVHAARLSGVPGFVDGSVFSDLIGDDCGVVEISIQGALLQALVSWDPELKELCGGLKSIEAVIAEDAEGCADVTRAQGEMRRIERDLLRGGWQRVTRIREEGTRLSVLVLATEETIEGLVVLGTGEDGELVFANIAGTLDLAAIERIGEHFDIPGLEDLDEP